MHNLNELRGLPLDQDTIGRVSQIMASEIRSGRKLSERIAYAYYETVLDVNGLGDAARKPTSERYTANVLRAGLTEFLEPHPDKKFNANAIGQCIQLGQKHVEDAGRRVTQLLTLDDDRMQGWARVSSGGKTCAFCAMLISRGPVYKTEQSAGGMTQWHAGCNCRPTYVINGDWAGRDQYEQADSLFRANSRDGIDSTGGKAKYRQLNTFRRNVGGTVHLPPLPAGNAGLRVA